ncbi:imidazole glycerol phosphate synthase subunit HisF [Halosquirtibacter xylanolyticus]|uniref:imidazole glycerol phosphate synthase subunit HisF n=1 Tax=Halosquirtibacter xylanolyticus TaxID=3374599 RepID=UPI003748907C|nr:imidazole glycerol phosphate synthase subunit HisF [Prolixibacteraceae bacterium]
MLAKRIIPCLDIKDGQTVKGIHFEGIKAVGDPVELAKWYSEEGADELVLLDITATQEARKTTKDLVKRIASEINIPFTIGGGISTVEDAAILLAHGADKVSINSSAIKNPDLINQLSTRFGSQFVVVAIDARQENGQWAVKSAGGRVDTDKELFTWAKEAEERGAGEILFTSMDHDGTKSGFANQALRHLHETLTIPVIASGGAGCQKDFVDTFVEGKADAALAASIFHYKEVAIPDLKSYLRQNSVPVRTI